MRISELIAKAYAEDLPQGDLTTDSLGLSPRLGNAKLVAKEDLVLAGHKVFEECVRYLEPDATFKWQFQDGDLVLNKQICCLIRADLLNLLKAERVALNFLGRMSGIATLTRCFVQKMGTTKCKILDTRKTTPLLRVLEKEAVRAGGGTNHRMNLSAAILIKDNHIRAAGSLPQAIRSVRKNHSGAIEVECATLDEVTAALGEGVHRILLDNMSLEDMRLARAKIPSSIEVEASGNMSLERVEAVAELGVNFISVGALTHSAPCADLSLQFDWSRGDVD